MIRYFDRQVARDYREAWVAEDLFRAINQQLQVGPGWKPDIVLVIEALVDQIAYLYVEVERLKEKQNA
jgi:hypothetical protein